MRDRWSRDQLPLPIGSRRFDVFRLASDNRRPNEPRQNVAVETHLLQTNPTRTAYNRICHAQTRNPLVTTSTSLGNA